MQLRHLHSKFCYCLACGILSFSISAVACEDIGLLANDGRYVILNGDNLNLKNVGNLWSLGIRGIASVVPDSNLSAAGLNVSDIYDSDGNLNQNIQQRTGVVTLQNLGINLAPGHQLPILTYPHFEDEYIENRIINTKAGFKLALQRYVPNNYVPTYKTTLEIYNMELEKEKSWELEQGKKSVIQSMHCYTDSGETIIAGYYNRAIIDEDELQIDSIVNTSEDGKSVFTGKSDKCFGLIGSSNLSDPNRVLLEIINLEENRIAHQFDIEQTSRAFRVFDYESMKGFQNPVSLIPVRSSGGFRTEPTNRASIADVKTGKIFNEKELPFAAKLHEKLLCKNESKRIIFTNPGMVYLIDFVTLEVIAEREIPFDVYFVL